MPVRHDDEGESVQSNDTSGTRCELQECPAWMPLGLKVTKASVTSTEYDIVMAVVPVQVGVHSLPPLMIQRTAEVPLLLIPHNASQLSHALIQPMRNTTISMEATATASSSSSDTEAQLWGEVKLSSFTLLFVSTYVLCGLTTLLKVQLHVLARAILRGEGPALESLGATGDNADDIVMYARDSALLKKFIEGTFRTMFSTGLQRFANDVRQRLQYLLRDWVVKERMRVDFEDMLQLLNTVRRNFGSDFDTLMRNLFC
eukprot:gene33211-42670_t